MSVPHLAHPEGFGGGMLGLAPEEAPGGLLLELGLWLVFSDGERWRSLDGCLCFLQ